MSNATYNGPLPDTFPGALYGHVVKFYGTGGGQHDKLFIFPYTGSLTDQKITLMAADLMQYYPRESLTTCEDAIRNLAERCSQTMIGRALPRDGVSTCVIRGDGWMNMRHPSAIIVHESGMGLPRVV